MIHSEQYLLNELKRLKKEARYYAGKRADEKAKEISNATNFSISIFYRDSVKYEDRPLYESIELEGFENAELIYSTYHKMAFNTKIQKLVMKMNNKHLKGINFKYNIDK